MSIVRALVLRTHESPRWLVTCGRIDEGVDVINRISAMNRSSYTISCRSVHQNWVHRRSEDDVIWRKHSPSEQVIQGKDTNQIDDLSDDAVDVGWYPLFTIFLPYYLRAHGADLGDSNWTISSVVGIFGPILSTWMVSNKWLRSCKSLVFMGAACAAFAGAFTSVKNPAEILAFSSMVDFWLNATYAIIYAYTPQALNVENRGLGNGLLMAVGRFASLSAPFIATYSDVTTSAPIWVACACFAAIGLIGLVLPVDTVPF
ncbi:synaptic vesicle transporter SV2 (major facilitator superfamily) [Colletotrichum asianum]